MYVTVEMLQEFSGKYPDDESILPQIYLDSALETVEKYLGYNPELADFSVTMMGDGGDTMALPFPVDSISAVSEDETEWEDFGWESVKNYLKVKVGGRLMVFRKGVPYTITGQSGYEHVPSAIVLCVLQIATLLWESAGGNLAVTSTSYADTGTRQFNSFKADRFLDAINCWRIYV